MRYYDAVKNKYFYYLTDHLGNNRIVAEDNGNVIQHTHYYPFGMAFPEAKGKNEQAYKYNGKEQDTRLGLNLYDYAARYMDNTIGRFTSVDPLTEKYYSISPYAYVMNNPLKFIDPDGRNPVLVPIIKGVVGGAFDISAQMTAYSVMHPNTTWGEAFSNVDWTSVGASTVTSAFIAPGMSTTTKVGVGAVVIADGMVDINNAGGIRTSEVIGGDKSVFESGMDMGGQLLPSKGTNTFTEGVIKDAANDFTKNTINTATKAEVKAGVKAVNSTLFQVTGQGVEVYGGGIMNAALKEATGVNNYKPTHGIKSSIPNESFALPSDATHVQLRIKAEKYYIQP